MVRAAICAPTSGPPALADQPALGSCALYRSAERDDDGRARARASGAAGLRTRRRPFPPARRRPLLLRRRSTLLSVRATAGRARSIPLTVSSTGGETYCPDAGGLDRKQHDAQAEQTAFSEPLGPFAAAHARTCNALSRYGLAEPRQLVELSSAHGVGRGKMRGDEGVHRCLAALADHAGGTVRQETSQLGGGALATRSHLPALEPSRSGRPAEDLPRSCEQARSHVLFIPTKMLDQLFGAKLLARDLDRLPPSSAAQDAGSAELDWHGRERHAASRRVHATRTAAKPKADGQERGGQPRAARPTLGRRLPQRDLTRALAERRRRQLALRRAAPGPPPRHPHPPAGLALYQPQNLQHRLTRSSGSTQAGDPNRWVCHANQPTQRRAQKRDRARHKDRVAESHAAGGVAET